MRKEVFIVTVIISIIVTLEFPACVLPIRASGTIYVRPDGAIDPFTPHIVSNDNVTYTLAGDVAGSIVIERSNIIVDGSGYILQGDGTETPNSWGFRIGLSLFGVANVTVKNMDIKGFHIGVGLEYSSICSVSRCNITANNPIGIVVTDSTNCSIQGNNIRDNQAGVYFGLPRQSNQIHPSNFNIVSGNVIKDNYEGIYLTPCSNLNMIFGNSVDNNFWGIELFDSFANNILGNNITHNHRGLDFRYSFRNTVSGNHITENVQYALLLRNGSAFNSVSGNTMMNNYCGICLDDSHYNVIFENDLAHDERGPQLIMSSKNTLYHNNFMTEHTEVTSSENLWDNGYPEGGNYWSGLSIPDDDSDRIGDRPHVIDSNNTDKYPLVYPYGFVPKPDVDGDRKVDNEDILVVAAAFGSRPGDSMWVPFADLDMDEIISMIDVARTARQHGCTVA